MQCSAVRCSAVQCIAVKCSIVQCSAVQCSVMQLSALPAHDNPRPRFLSSLIHPSLFFFYLKKNIKIISLGKVFFLRRSLKLELECSHVHLHALFFCSIQFTIQSRENNLSLKSQNYKTFETKYMFYLLHCLNKCPFSPFPLPPSPPPLISIAPPPPSPLKTLISYHI